MDESSSSQSTPFRGDEPMPQIPDHEVFPTPLGGGSYGKVYLARNVMGTWRAVKVVCRSRFLSDRPYDREFDGVRKFEPVSHGHPSQLPIFQVGRNDAAGYLYYVMEAADDAGCQIPDVGGAAGVKGEKQDAVSGIRTLASGILPPTARARSGTS